MAFDPIIAIIVVLIIVVAVGLGRTMLTGRPSRADMGKLEATRREERAHQERLEQERQERYEEVRKEENEAMVGARKRMAFAQENLHQVQQEFKRHHDQLIADIHLQAKAGCDAQFQQRFGITRPPKAPNPEHDEEVQGFLRQHYAGLRDAVLAESIEELIREEAQRRLDAAAAAEEEAAAAATEDEAEATLDVEQEAVAIADEANAEAAEAEVEAEGEPAPEAEETPEGDESGESDEAPEQPEEASPSDGEEDAEPAAETADQDGDAEGEEDEEPAPEDEPETAGDSEEGEDEVDAAFEETLSAVREEFDVDSVRTYLLAAISARYDQDKRPIGDLPWPAFTNLSTRGYGELVLAEGAPVYAQDSYREFAWKKFHTGRRSEKPTRGEYSWPASHELGDGIPTESVPTPAGVFAAEGPKGPLPLYELLDCTWMRHSLDYKGALLEPDGQRSFFINLLGLHKGDELRLSFDGQDFLEELEDGPYFLNAMGEVNGAYVGLSASKPEAANLGEAPYELIERTPTGFVFRMTYDARRYDVDTYPQFLEVHLAWCQPPSPRPDRIVRHVAN